MAEQVNNDKELTKRKKYTIEFKMDVLEKLDRNKGNKAMTSRQTGVDRRIIGDWLTQRDKLMAQHFKRVKHRIVEGEREGFWPEMEEKLMEWFLNERANNRAVGAVHIKHKSISLINEEKENLSPGQVIKPFSASEGWLRNFLNRYDVIINIELDNMN